MFDTIWKYKLNPAYVFHAISMPVDYHVLSTGIDAEGEVCVWAAVNSEAPQAKVTFALCGTGRALPERFGEFIGSVKDGPFVWHIYMGENHPRIQIGKREYEIKT